MSLYYPIEMYGQLYAQMYSMPAYKEVYKFFIVITKIVKLTFNGRF